MPAFKLGLAQIRAATSRVQPVVCIVNNIFPNIVVGSAIAGEYSSVFLSRTFSASNLLQIFKKSPFRLLCGFKATSGRSSFCPSRSDHHHPKILHCKWFSATVAELRARHEPGSTRFSHILSIVVNGQSHRDFLLDGKEPIPVNFPPKSLNGR